MPMPPIKEKNQKKSKIAFNICSFSFYKIKSLSKYIKLLINNNKTL
jgi:hypothetical protein